MSIRNERAAALPAKLSRSWLLVPPRSQEDLVAAEASEADSVIFDIEDGTPDDRKDAARALVVDQLAGDMSAWVRINPAGSELWKKDVAALRGLPGLRGVMLAKTEHHDHVAGTVQALGPGTPVLALIESALGLERAVEIAKASGTFRLAFGTGDFRKDTGIGTSPTALAYARSRLVIASRVGELPGPIDGPTRDDVRLTDDCAVTAEMGMTGKLCLRIGQVEAVNRLLAPSDAEIAWAKELLAEDASGQGGADGSYLPRLARAKKISRLADSFGLWNR